MMVKGNISETSLKEKLPKIKLTSPRFSIPAENVPSYTNMYMWNLLPMTSQSRCSRDVSFLTDPWGGISGSKFTPGADDGFAAFLPGCGDDGPLPLPISPFISGLAAWPRPNILQLPLTWSVKGRLLADCDYRNPEKLNCYDEVLGHDTKSTTNLFKLTKFKFTHKSHSNNITAFF